MVKTCGWFWVKIGLNLFVGWLVGWLVGSLVGWLVDWLVEWVGGWLLIFDRLGGLGYVDSSYTAEAVPSNLEKILNQVLERIQ